MHKVDYYGFKFIGDNNHKAELKRSFTIQKR